MKKQTVDKPISLLTRAEREELEAFKKGVDEFIKRHSVSREAALKLLVKEGIYTKSGRLSKNYR